MQLNKLEIMKLIYFLIFNLFLFGINGMKINFHETQDNNRTQENSNLKSNSSNLNMILAINKSDINRLQQLLKSGANPDFIECDTTPLILLIKQYGNTFLLSEEKNARENIVNMIKEIIKHNIHRLTVLMKNKTVYCYSNCRYEDPFSCVNYFIKCKQDLYENMEINNWPTEDLEEIDLEINELKSFRKFLYQKLLCKKF